jgi:hypothetical protein
MSKEIPAPFQAPGEFAGEEKKLAKLRLSQDITDQLTIILMEAQLGEEKDCFGLWYSFARPKALAIMKRFNVTDKSSSLPEG